MANKYKLILAKIGSNPSVKTRELIYEYINNCEKKEIEFRDEIIYKEVITQFKDFSVKKDSNSDISENQKEEKK